MFEKKNTLFEVPTTKKVTAETTTTGNAFLNAGMKQSATALSGNGAKKYSETDNDFVTEFGKLGEFRKPRGYDDVACSMSTLWAEDYSTALKFAFYIRMVTRKVKRANGQVTEAPQRGQGLKNEGIMRMMWVAVNHPEIFKANLPLFISIGAWKDVFEMLRLDLTTNGWDGRVLDWDFMGNVISAGLENPETSELVKKYLPTIKAKSKCRTPDSQANHLIGAWLANKFFPSEDESGKVRGYKQYRQLKSSGTAHQWQQCISRGVLTEINFDSVAGRALAQLVSGKFLENQKLTQTYEEWIASKPVAKFTGFPHELFAPYVTSMTRPLKSLKPYEEMTINKQFDGLVELGKESTQTNTGLIVVRDTSGSMGGLIPGQKISAFDVAKAMALYFSEFLTGEFVNSWIEFNNNAKMHKWQGSTPVEKWNNDKSWFNGGTDFLSVIRLFAQLKQQGVSEEDFPKGILCVSDGNFNPACLGATNIQVTYEILARAGFSQEYIDNFQVILWNIPNGYYGSGGGNVFETYESDTPNMFYMSGYDPASIAFLTGATVNENGETVATPKSAKELFEAAMNQEILSEVLV